MKTLKDLKGRTVKVHRKVVINAQAQRDRIIRLLQPEQFCNEFHIENDVKLENFTIGKDKIYCVAKCDKFQWYELSTDRNKQMSEFGKLESVVWVEKIHRFLYTVTNFEYEIEMDIKTPEPKDGELYFRPSGDYIFYYDDKKSYGEKIKSENLIKNDNQEIIGITKDDWYCNTIIYNFKEV